MPELLQYDFTVVGMANIEKALASLERRFAQHNARINSTLAKGGGSGRAGSGGGLRPGTGGMAGAEAVREQTALMKKLEREQLASVKRVERERISSEKAVGREQEKQEKYWANARQRSRAADMRQHQQEASARADFMRSTVGRGAGRVFGAARAVGTAGLAMTGIGGAALAASSVSEATRLDDMARRTAIQAREAGTAGMDPDALRKRYVQTGLATGVAPEQVAAGVSRYVDRTGDLAGGLTHMNTFATVAQASGANTTDLADSAWALRQAGVTSKEDVQSSLSTLYMQGKKGSFKLADQAQFLPELIAKGKDFGVRGTEGVKGLGGLLQITQDATGDAAETATSVKDTFSELTKHSAKMATGEAFGGRKVNVYEKGDAKNGARNIRDIIGDTLTASRGDSAQLEEVLGKRGMPAIQGMLNEFKDTRLASLKGGDSDTVATQKGHDAALKIWDKAADVTGNFTDVERDAADAMKGFGVQIENIEAQLKAAMASELFPVLRDLAPRLGELIGPVRNITGVLVKLAEELLGHPLIGLGAILAASVASEVLKAKLGTVFENTIKRLSGQAVPAGAGYTGLGGKSSGGTTMGTLGAIGVGASIGITLASVILTTGIVNFENGEVNMKNSGANLNAVRDSSDPEFVRKQVEEQRKKVNDLKSPGFFASMDQALYPGQKASGLSSALDNAITPNKNVNLKTEESFLETMEAKLAKLDSEAMAKAQMEAAAALKEAAVALKGSAGGTPNTGNSPSPVKK